MLVTKRESVQARLLAETPDKVKAKIIQELKGEGFSRHKVQKRYLMPVPKRESGKLRVTKSETRKMPVTKNESARATTGRD